MPENAMPGNYSLRIEGLSGPNSFVFRNETPLLFRVKHVSVFISTDKVFYKHRSTVHFRVVALKPNLLPVMSGSISICVKDAYGRVVRRWIGQQLRNGYYEKSFATDHPARHGWWSIEVEGWGYKYKPCRFRTHLYLKTKMDVNVTIPSYITDNEYALSGVVKAAHTTGIGVKGNATVVLQIQPKGVTAKNKFVKITKTTPHFTKEWAFVFPLAEMRKDVPSLLGAKLVVSAVVTDWYFIETKLARAYSVVYSGKTYIRFLGGTVRVFKPGSPLNVYIAVYHQDGSRYSAMIYRQVAIQTSVRRRNGGTVLKEEIRRMIPEDSIVRYSFTPGSDDEMVTISAAHDGLTREYKQMTAWRHYSRRNEHLKVTTSTSEPEVNTYIIFTVRCSVYVPEVHYMIVAGGNIIVTDTLFMKYRQKTFSVALSRDMVPNAKVIVSCIVNGGEVLADSLSFFVSGIRNNGVDIRLTMGKDISGSTTEVIATGDPGGFVALGTGQYHLYQSGASSFFRKYDVEEDLSSYDDHTTNSYTQTWLLDEARRENVHFHASSNAIDANTTFSVSVASVAS
ncbi:hypothetical protein LSAT2_007430 [Lamellibrachia satsuma]|nr:hypothetical protein LSAT2_007430 [Lamellibrachia satsuma]